MRDGISFTGVGLPAICGLVVLVTLAHAAIAALP